MMTEYAVCAKHELEDGAVRTFCILVMTHQRAYAALGSMWHLEAREATNE
jgi:hypothetical protein